MKTYSFKKSFIKGVTTLILFAIPFALQATPEEYLNLTIGGILVIILNAVKFFYTQNFK